MKDNYDDEVIKWGGLFHEMKYYVADSLQYRYTTGFNTIVKMSEELQKIQLAELDLYKKNLKDMELIAAFVRFHDRLYKR